MQDPFVAYWILLAGAIMPYLLVGVAKAGPAYDNTDPRNPAALNTPLRQFAYGAHQNCLEAFPLFAAAVLLAGLRHAPAGFVDVAAAVWLAFRLVFVACYLTRQGTLRSLAWGVATSASLTIFVFALVRGTGA